MSSGIPGAARRDPFEPLVPLGWDERLEFLSRPHLEAGLTPARVIRDDGPSLLLAGIADPFRAEPSHGLDDPLAVGDWVMVRPRPGHDLALIEVLLPRTSELRRAREDGGGPAQAQVLAANVQTVFLVHAATGEAARRAQGAGLNLRRMERETAQVWDSGADPVLILSKADLSDDPHAAAAAASAALPGVPVHLVNGITGEGVDELRAYAAGRRTLVLIGPSGVGKSTLTNRLLGLELQDTGGVRDTDSKGRHTTTARHLLALPGGGALIDTPGLRSFGLWDAEAGVDRAFADVEALAQECRFRDCRHQEEPGCAVAAAIDAGDLEAERLEAMEKLAREMQQRRTKTDKLARAAQRKEHKRFARMVREHSQRKPGLR